MSCIPEPGLQLLEDNRCKEAQLLASQVAINACRLRKEILQSQPHCDKKETADYEASETATGPVAGTGLTVAVLSQLSLHLNEGDVKHFGIWHAHKTDIPVMLQVQKHSTCSSRMS